MQGLQQMLAAREAQLEAKAAEQARLQDVVTQLTVSLLQQEPCSTCTCSRAAFCPRVLARHELKHHCQSCQQRMAKAPLYELTAAPVISVHTCLQHSLPGCSGAQ